MKKSNGGGVIISKGSVKGSLERNDITISG
jgi:hypothetical protein